MPNHYHIMLSPRHDGNVTKFMKKINMGYARYFNEKYNRSGALFEGRYKRILVKNESHFVHLPYYIHLNPLDLFALGWRKRELRDHKKAMKFLETYRWSSHMDYLGKKYFPSIIKKDFLIKFYGSEIEYKRSIESWLRSIEINNLRSFVSIYE